MLGHAAGHRHLDVGIVERIDVMGGAGAKGRHIERAAEDRVQAERKNHCLSHKGGMVSRGFRPRRKMSRDRKDLRSSVLAEIGRIWDQLSAEAVGIEGDLRFELLPRSPYG